jgi:hypothetical protein
MFHSKAKAWIDEKKRAHGIDSKQPDYLEVQLRSRRKVLAKMTGMAPADIGPDVASLDAVIQALQSSHHPNAASTRTQLQKARKMIDSYPNACRPLLASVVPGGAVHLAWPFVITSINAVHSTGEASTASNPSTNLHHHPCAFLSLQEQKND